MHKIIEKLQKGEIVKYTAHGNSMFPKIKNKEEVVLSPVTTDPEIDDIVFCKVKGKMYLHLVTTIKIVKKNKKFLISNNKGHDNGWIGINAIFGVKK